MYLENFDGLFDSNDIYDTLNNAIYAYDSNNNSWYLTNRKVSDEVADYSRIYNENTEKSFVYYDEKSYMTSCNSGNTFNVTTTAGNSNLQWNTEVTLGTVGGLAIKAKLPQNPNTDTTYSAGTNMNLSGTTMNLNDSISVNSVNTGSLVVDGWTISIG